MRPIVGSVPSDVPTSVARVLDRAMADDPHREALVTRHERLTYAALDRRADQAAQALRALGVQPGDRVAASLHNEAAVVVAFHGAMRLGAVWVGVNRVLAPPEKAFILDDCGASLLLGEEDVPGTAVRAVLPDEWQAAVGAAEPHPVGRDVDPYAPAGIAYTSGTTGHPKGAVHSQWNLLVPGAALVASRGYGPALRKGDCFPFTILNMAVLTTLLVSQAGGCSIVMDRIDAEGVAEWIRTERVTTWNGPPVHTSSSDARSDGATVPAGATGEIRVGPADDRYRPMLGYWERPEATAEALVDGELCTGDLGAIDADGYLHVRDRKSLLIIRGGANVYPAEVERVLLEAPGVVACAVVGVPDERLGERIVAVVEGAPIDEGALRAHCLAQLARYKVPERFVAVDALPRNAMGKIVRTDLPSLL